VKKGWPQYEIACLAEVCQGTVSLALKNKQLISSGRGRIDPDHPINRQWITLHQQGRRVDGAHHRRNGVQPIGLRRIDFGRLIGVSKATVARAIQRGQLICEADATLSPDHPQNRQWLEMRLGEPIDADWAE
jgi:hypothetical protein